MLKNYSKYSNIEILNESFIKPDPAGIKKLYDSKSYYAEFNKIHNEALSKVKEQSATLMTAKLKEDLVGKIICLLDETGKQKILEVGDVILGNKGQDYYPVIKEADDGDKGRTIRYMWESEPKSKIFDMGRFLDFFETHYLDQLIMYNGKSTKGGELIKYVKTVVQIGIMNSALQDFITVVCDDETSQLLIHTDPIKLMDKKVKEIDPYGEENWDQ